MDIKNIVFVVVFVFSFGILFFSLSRVIGFLKTGISEDRFDRAPERIYNVFKVAIAQSKIFRDPLAGPLHAMIFWGFLIFLFAVLESIFQGFNSSFSLDFLGNGYTVISFVQDIFGLLVIFAVLFALYRRYVLKISRLENGQHAKMDATLILILILIVVLSMFGQNAAAIALNPGYGEGFEYRPVSEMISGFVFTGSANIDLYYEIFWWIHILVIFTFMNILPYSKHFHVITSLPNVFFNKLSPNKYVLKAIDLEDEDAEQFGAADIDHLSWKQMLDGYSCTECGRCTAVCPAANSGKPLSPRKIITDIRKRTEEKAPLLVADKDSNNELIEKTLIHNYITTDEIWACTTCNACVYECPVTIEHVDSIVDLRRNLVLMESDFPPELNAVFKNLETNFNPWAFNSQDRAEWAEGMNIKTMSQDSDTEYLFWVGCSGSFDSRYQKVTKAFAKIMQKGGVNFRILGNEEKCNGDTARRLGNEYLAQTMMQENIELMNNYGVKKIVTACPHCFNSIKNEYPQFGGNFEVINHTQLIEELIKTGKIHFNDSEKLEKITYHDSCYLGRYNGIYESPRNALNEIEGVELIEMERTKDKAFCCGAGGGRMFLEETIGSRINEDRTKEALNTGAQTIASACPFCMTMLSDGTKAFEKQEDVAVKDIAEIILEKLK